MSTDSHFDNNLPQSKKRRVELEEHKALDDACRTLSVLVAEDPTLDKSFATAQTSLPYLSCHPRLVEILNSVKSLYDTDSYLKYRLCKELDPLRIKDVAGAAYSHAYARVRDSFHKTPFVGNAALCLKAHLAANNARIRHQQRFPNRNLREYPGKFCSIIQSAGTGKSRLVHELGKHGTVVLYMNFKDRGTIESYPPCDEFLRMVLLPDNRNSLLVEFMAAMFAQITNTLTRLAEACNGDHSKMVEEWDACMTSSDYFHRRVFFSGTIKRIFDIRSDETKDPRRLLEEAFTELSNMFDDQTDEPQVVIAFDEASSIDDRSQHLCEVISSYSRAARVSIWVLFISTERRVADFTVPKMYPESADARSFEPFCSLGCDQFNSSQTLVNPREIATYRHLQCLGRPLWKSLEDGLPPWQVLQLAKRKLYGSAKAGYKPGSWYQYIAVLSQRICLALDLHDPDVLEQLDATVADNMRVCLTASESRRTYITGYPSEPILSNAAAQIWHEPEVLHEALEYLASTLNECIVRPSRHGETVSRAMWQICKDSCARDLEPEQDSDQNEALSPDGLLTYCRFVPLVSFLEKMFGAEFWPEGEEVRAAVMAVYKNAFVNFSHWSAMGEKIATIDGLEDPDFDPQAWTRAHGYRTSAVQCHSTQELVTKMIPIYFDDLGLWSQLFASDRLSEPGAPTDVGSIDRAHKHIRCTSPVPWVAVVLDLGVPDPGFVRSTYTPQDGGCLRIYAAGLNSAIFPFLKEQQHLEADIKYVANQEIRYDYHLRLVRREVLEQGCFGISSSRSGSSRSELHL